MILVVEDFWAMGRCIRAMLEAGGHEVTLVASGEDALAFLARRRPALVVLDVSLPGISGLDVLRHIRADPHLRDVPVIVDTTSADPKVHAVVARAGARLVGKHTDEFVHLSAIVADRLAPAPGGKL